MFNNDLSSKKHCFYPKTLWWQVPANPITTKFYKASKFVKKLALITFGMSLGKVKASANILSRQTLHEKCPNTEFFLVRIFLYSVRIQENTDQKKLRIWTLFTQWELFRAASLIKIVTNYKLSNKNGKRIYFCWKFLTIS